MKALITADWHLAEGMRDAYRFVFVEKTLPALIKKHDIDLLFFLGDVTEHKSGHEAELVNRVVAAFFALGKLCPVICLQGNHDWLSDPSNPYFGFLQRLAGVSWVLAPTPMASVKNVPAAFARACKGILLPHTADFERDWGHIDFKAYDWAFAHQSFAGAVSESGHALNGVPLSYFPKKLQIVAGDIHQPQTVGPLTYVGSPYSVDFGDEIEPRVLLWEGGELTSVPVPGPQKRLVTLSGRNPLAALRMNHPMAEIFSLQRGDILKVRCEVGNYDDWPRIQKEIEAWAAEGGYVLHQTQPLIQNAVSAGGPATRILKTDEELFAEYGKRRAINEATLKAGFRLL